MEHTEIKDIWVGGDGFFKVETEESENGYDVPDVVFTVHDDDIETADGEKYSGELSCYLEKTPNDIQVAKDIIALLQKWVDEAEANSGE